MNDEEFRVAHRPHFVSRVCPAHGLELIGCVYLPFDDMFRTVFHSNRLIGALYEKIRPEDADAEVGTRWIKYAEKFKWN